MLRCAKGAAGLIAIVILAVVFSPRALDGSIIFLDSGNLTDVLRQVSVVGIIALAMTYVILTGGIDLSVGSILALSTCVLATVLTEWSPAIGYGGHITLAVLAAVAASALVGTINGFVISTLAIPPFIVTLATMIGIRGLAKRLTNNATLNIGFGHDAAGLFADVVGSKLLAIVLLSLLAAIFWLVLTRTVFGRYVRAIGDNERAARYTGLPLRAVKVWVYTLSGMVAGVAGVLYAAQANQGDPNSGVAYELDVIAAVVIGGTSLAGGRGSIAGTIVGILIIGVLTNILGLNNVDSNVQMMIKAVIIIFAVWIQKLERTE
ncbi:MAG: ABC transporter permease [Betaproteobacteria bacterium]|nr:ABC transporter permease [Betaproteobacteria bacterium]